MAPALGPAFLADSLEKINIPVAIVAGTVDTNVPIASSAQFFAKHFALSSQRSATSRDGRINADHADREIPFAAMKRDDD